jgi:hypothetical protein
MNRTLKIAHRPEGWIATLIVKGKKIISSPKHSEKAAIRHLNDQLCDFGLGEHQIEFISGE